MMSALSVVLLALAQCTTTNGFQPPLSPTKSSEQLRSSLAFGVRERPTSAVGPLYFWGNNNKDKDKEDATDAEENKENKDGKSSDFLGGLLPFFANQNEETTKQPEKEPPTPTSVAVAPEPPSPAPTRPKPVIVEELDPVKKAAALRAQAERARLEAEKMDAELTLQKISRLEREMASAVAKDETDNVERLQREMDALQAKVRGEAPQPVAVPKRAETTSSSSSASETSDDTVTSSSSPGQLKNGFMPTLMMNEGDMEGLVNTVENSPNFLKKLFAQMTEIDFVSASDINATEVATRMVQMQNMDFSYSRRPKPTFTQAEIDQAITEKKFADVGLDEDRLKEDVKGNATAKALMALEYEYYLDQYDMNKVEQLLDGEDWLKEVIDAVNRSEVDSLIEAFYPKCTRKEESPEPTLAHVQALVAEVLPKASFTARGEPEKVLGGYIVRGTSKFESGDETIAAIDEQMEKFRFQDKMTVLYTSDFTLIPDDMEDMNDFRDPEDEPPILYIMGPDIVPERKRIALSVTTAFGIATSWYLSVYPFLLNPALMKRTEEQLALADASMAYDLSWLTELSLPLFVTFMGIQLAHEAGHKLVGGAYGVSTTFPTFVPSLITGVTSTVTQFKEPPKNKEVMLDFAVAGPLAGMVASIAALAVGSQLTLVSDPSTLPALPLDILRQSTLGGGIIDAVLGAGALSVPAGAVASEAVAGMTVSLHPVAIAGYIGLVLNGLALLPIGTTDGGRIALALFGRGVKNAIGNLFLAAVFFIGIFGSDLFLFYFSFLIAFQTGNEIPARNEVDTVSFSRVLLATASTVLALLTLIPFQ